MPQYHRVKQGECLDSIAAHYGFADYRSIYGHPQNIRLKEKRRNPNILFPGDVLFIPDKQDKHDPRDTGQLHTHVIKSSTVLLRIYLKDRRGRPLANESYELRSSLPPLSGTTDNNGLLHMYVPIALKSAELFLGDFGRIRTLQIGDLDPIETVSGVQSRLNNLGYDVGPIDGIDGPRTRAAIIGFQQTHALVSVDGTCDFATRAKLLKEYGS